MLVEVRLLRSHGGQRLASAHVKAAAPACGQLLIEKYPDRVESRLVTTARLVAPDRVANVLPPLEDVQILRWRGAELVLAGLEYQDRHRKRTAVIRQAWWVRIPAASSPPTLSPV